MDVKFIYADYTYFSNYQGCLIYCDPPYHGTTQYGANKEFYYNKFWNWIREVSKNNIVLISEYSAPEDFKCIFEKTLTTILDKNSRKQDTEKLFLHKNIYNI